MNGDRRPAKRGVRRGPEPAARAEGYLQMVFERLNTEIDRSVIVRAMGADVFGESLQIRSIVLWRDRDGRILQSQFRF